MHPISLLALFLTLAACSTPAKELSRCVDERVGPGYLDMLASAEAALLDSGVLSASTRAGYLDLNRRIYAAEVPDAAGCGEVYRRTGESCWSIGTERNVALFSRCLPEVEARMAAGSDVPFVEAMLDVLTDEQFEDVRYRGVVIAQTLNDLESIDLIRRKLGLDPLLRPDR